METLQSAIDAFIPIDLKEMDAVALLDRTDTKYLFHISKLPLLLQGLQPLYRMLEVKGIRQNKYESHYFDDDNCTFYHMHHNKFGKRFKVRYRKYVDSAISFFEIKKKINTNRTIKKRIPTQEIGCAVTGEEKAFFEKITHLNADVLHPTVRVDYTRLTLVSNDLTERATFDLHIAFKNNGHTKSFDELVIVEVKQNKIDHSSPVIRQLKNMHITEASLSKYCMGVYQLYDNVKKNNFKPQAHNLSKILKNKTWS
ncbi:MAG: polyphosphate polymerase domain-containing protein [Bacteroidia bacterium]|nr:polyphosphate polymerase domain-containing protein [Bacteroidia bacterium]HQU99871.1 polyphosphate polymerase domain-containing protein [Bacteroidia bacterium]